MEDAAVVLSDSDLDGCPEPEWPVKVSAKSVTNDDSEMESQTSLVTNTTETVLATATTVEPAGEPGLVQKMSRRNACKSATPPYPDSNKRQEINESGKEINECFSEASSSYNELVQLCNRVVVQDKGGVMMDKLRATLLRKTIEKKQYKLFKENRGKLKKERRLPVFWEWPQLMRGCLRMSPKDDFTLSWLVSTVQCLPTLWEGSRGFRVIPESELPRYHTAIIKIPNFGNDIDDLETLPYTLREFLAELNENVNIEEWPIYEHLVTQKGENFNHILIMGVPKHGVDELERVDFRLYFGTGSIYVKVKNNKTGTIMGPKAEVEKYLSSASTDVKSAKVPPDNKEWTNKEIGRLTEVGNEGKADISNVSMEFQDESMLLSPWTPTETEEAEDQPEDLPGCGFI